MAVNFELWQFHPYEFLNPSYIASPGFKFQISNLNRLHCPISSYSIKESIHILLSFCAVFLCNQTRGADKSNVQLLCFPYCLVALSMETYLRSMIMFSTFPVSTCYFLFCIAWRLFSQKHCFYQRSCFLSSIGSIKCKSWEPKVFQNNFKSDEKKKTINYLDCVSEPLVIGGDTLCNLEIGFKPNETLLD